VGRLTTKASFARAKNTKQRNGKHATRVSACKSGASEDTAMEWEDDDGYGARDEGTDSKVTHT